jgi:hypothetical protein
MCHHREAFFSAVGGKEQVFVDKKTIDCQLNILLELISSLEILITLWRKLFVFLLTVFPFILRTEQSRIAFAALASVDVTSQPGILALTISLKSVVKGKIIFSYRSFA